MFAPFIEVLTQKLPYHKVLPPVFATLCQQKTNTLLLESANLQ